MTAKLVYLCALTAALFALVVLLIVRQPAQVPQLVETIVGALILALGHGANAVFHDSATPAPGKPDPNALPAQSPK